MKLTAKIRSGHVSFPDVTGALHGSIEFEGFAELDAVRALIDAAPALLLALEGLTEAMWGSLDSGREIPAEMSVAARAAIKAARRK